MFLGFLTLSHWQQQRLNRLLLENPGISWETLVVDLLRPDQMGRYHFLRVCDGIARFILLLVLIAAAYATLVFLFV